MPVSRPALASHTLGQGDFDMDTGQDHCSCIATSRYQSTFVMPPRSLAGRAHNYQAQLDAKSRALLTVEAEPRSTNAEERANTRDDER